MSESTFLDAAFGIGARLCRDALWHGERCNWLGAAPELVGRHWTSVERTFGPELYSGTSGIAYFLSRLYRITGEAALRTTAEGAARQALSRLEDIHPTARVGFYSGLMGIAFTLVELGESTGDGRWTEEGLKLSRSLARLDLEDQQLDVLAGMAGVIPALLSLRRHDPGGDLVALALALGDHLIARARRRDNGWSWATPAAVGGQDDLLGFSHGTSGIAWALLELAHASYEERFRRAALEGFRYERHWYSAEQENWPDLRDLEGLEPAIVSGNGSGAEIDSEPVYPVQWCHGAPGIGLSRLRAYDILGEASIKAEAEAAIRTTLRDLDSPQAAAWNYSLCHGRAGNAELLLLASRVLGNPGYRTMAENVGRQGIATYEQQGLAWPSGVMGGAETPNLMLGTAGTGYFLLRLYDPEATPSVLIVMPE